MSSELYTAITAAKLAAQKALSYYNTSVAIQYKSDKTPVTIADKECEEIIKKSIRTAFPQALFVGEETGGSIKEKEFWTIDPIDGTRYFTRNIPLWAILISYYKDNQVACGVSYMPLLDELMYAEKGKGAYINNDKITLSEVSKLSSSLVLYGNPKYLPTLDTLVPLIQASGTTRSITSAYDFHLVASGRADASLDGYGKIWDLAPFKVIVEEAGGKMTSFSGEPWTKNTEGGIVSNGKIHDEIISLVNQKRE